MTFGQEVSSFLPGKVGGGPLPFPARAPIQTRQSYQIAPSPSDARRFGAPREPAPE